jgi:hypothetical protein
VWAWAVQRKRAVARHAVVGAGYRQGCEAPAGDRLARGLADTWVRLGMPRPSNLAAPAAVAPLASKLVWAAAFLDNPATPHVNGRVPGP